MSYLYCMIKFQIGILNKMESIADESDIISWIEDVCSSHTFIHSLTKSSLI